MYMLRQSGFLSPLPSPLFSHLLVIATKGLFRKNKTRYPNNNEIKIIVNYTENAVLKSYE